MTIRVVLKPCEPPRLDLPAQWIGVWQSPDGIQSLQGRTRELVEEAIRRRVGVDVEFYVIGSDKWFEVFG